MALLETILARRTRLLTLRRTGLLDSPPEEAFDRLTRLAARFLDAPVALVSLVDEERQFFKSCFGLPEPWATGRETPLSHSFCQHVVIREEALIVEDAREHPLVKENLAIPDLGVMAYAGIPLTTSRGEVLGSFCAIDTKPRRWTEEEIRTLRDLAASVTTEIQRRAEEAPRNGEECFRALVENAEDVITILGSGGIIRYESPSAERVLGHRQEERIGRNIFGWVHPEDAAAVIDTFTNRIQLPSSTATVTYRSRHDNGSWRVLHSTGKNLVEHPAVGGVVVVSRDITAEKEARTAQNRLASILDSSTDFVATTDPLGRVHYLNRAARQMVGIPDAEDASWLNLPDFYPLQAREQILQEGMPAAVREGAWSTETFLLHRSGREIPVSLVLRSHLTPRGAVEFFSVTARDITERKRAEEELRQAQKMEAVGRLAGGVAHDFNNVLTVIKGNAQLLLLEVPEGHPMREEITEIDGAASRAAALTQQLLALSRKQVLQPRVLDLNAVVLRTEKMLHRLIGEDVELLTVLDSSLGQVLADPGQMEQVIMNLAVNARDAMPHGGRLVIQTENVREGSSGGDEERGQRSYVVLEVSDTGSGMHPTIQERIFEPFFTTKEQGKGTGLGLSTVYGIVQHSGGYIRVESQEGAGTTFRIYLPQRDGTSYTSCEPVRAAPLGGTGTVLLVEDEAPVRNVARRALQGLGYRVLEASGGAEAIEIAKDHAVRIDLLLTDVVMPGMSGPRLAELLMSDRPDLQVLYMSGYIGDMLDQHGVNEPGAAFLQKPFAPEDLAQKIRERLHAGSPNEPGRS